MKKHYSERQHARTTPKGPARTEGIMSWRRFKKWVLSNTVPTGGDLELPRGYRARNYLRARKVDTYLSRVNKRTVQLQGR